MPVDSPRDAPALHDDRGPPRRSAVVGLRSVLVRYESGSDRRTLYPPDADEHERLTRWLSADDDAFVDLDGAR